jgi:hypothetical protein
LPYWLASGENCDVVLLATKKLSPTSISNHGYFAAPGAGDSDAPFSIAKSSGWSAVSAARPAGVKRHTRMTPSQRDLSSVARARLTAASQESMKFSTMVPSAVWPTAVYVVLIAVLLVSTTQH